MRKKFLSVFIAMLLIMNCFPLSVIAEFEGSTDPIEVFLEEGFADKITVEDKEYDGKLTAIVHCEDVTLINANTMEPVAGYDVYLACNGEFERKDASDEQNKVTVSKFCLEGNDRNKFKLSGNYDVVEKYAYITPKELKVIPKETWIYYGQAIPENFEYTVEQPEEYNVDLNVKIAVQGEPKNIGEYDYVILEQTSDNPNYIGKISESSKFRIKEYSPEEKYLLNDETYYSNHAKLTAPDGFEISSDGNNFSNYIIVDLEETTVNHKKQVSYYLRNVNDGAISRELKHSYCCSTSSPEIVGAKISKVKSDSFLGSFPFGIVSNDNVMLTITAKGTGVDQETLIYLNGENGYSQYCSAKLCTESNGVYYYTAEFNIKMPDSKFFRSSFETYAKNKAGRGNEEELNIEFDNESSNVLILDKISPKVESMQIVYHNNEGYVEATGTLKDSESGIDTIEYFWNLKEDNKLVKYGINDNGECEYTKVPNGDVNFSVKLKYDDAPIEKYPYELKLKITDNAGNFNEDLYKYSNAENGRDTQPPNIEIKGFRTKGSAEYKDCVNFLKFGNYARDDIELVVEAKDISETDYVTGVGSVSLCNGDSVIEELNSSNAANEYVFVISKNTRIDNMVIRAADKNGFSNTANVIDQITEMKENTLVVENDPPEVSFDTSKSSTIEDNGEKIYWYNTGDSIFSVKVTDVNENDKVCSGLASVKIIDEHNGIINVLDDKSFSENQENDYSFSTEISKLSEGIHYIKVETTDNAGNNCGNYPAVMVIGVDTKKPVGKTSIEGPEPVDINGDKWFDKDQIIEFRVDAEPDVSGIKDITLDINGIKKTFTENEIKSNEHGYCVTADTTGIEIDDKHRYVVSGTITNVAGSCSELAVCTAYVDCKNPVIEKFTVEKKSSALDKILNVLSFGVYSNDDLIFKVSVSDDIHDSGIDNVKIKYNGIDEQALMTRESDKTYSYIIHKNTKVFQSNLIVTAYDKYGKKSLSCPNIENADQGKGVSDNVFAMIETEKPKVTISKPKGDGIVRNDKQIWFNSNKDISITIYDKDSGIRNADIKVNGIDVTADKNGTIIPKISTTEIAKVRDNEKHTYYFDTDYFTEIAGESADGRYEVKVSVVDNAGNVNSKESFTYHIDNKSPNVDRFEFLPATSDNISETSEYIEYLEYGYYFQKNFIANIHISDSAPSSGLNKAEYRLVSYDNGELKGEKTGEVIISDGIAHIDIPVGFKGQIFVKAFDNVGNYSDEETPKAFVADDIPPEINISEIDGSRYSDANGNKLFTDDIAVTVTITDTKSGIREIGYYQTSENDGFERRVLEIDGTGVEVDSEIGDGWAIVKKDVNLVTEITKTFIFDKDNNDITLTFDAMDNSGNVNESVQSETFTIDKTAPIINVDINNGINNTIYYNAENIAVMTIDVIERNFDARLIQAEIENTYNGNVPNISFQDLSVTEHRAVITFSEGDYTFGIRGTDLGGHSAGVNLDHEKVQRFYVDETSPVVEENFSDFINRDNDNYFNTKKTAVIKITEHNFDPSLVGLKILKKDAGAKHNENDFTDVTYSMLSMADWSDDIDTHTLSIIFDDDAVYRVEISPSDPSGNTSGYKSSEIFEIDTTLPVVSSKNGILVDEKNALNFLDIYPYERKDEAAPTVEFTDVNFDHIKYDLTVYTPEYTNGRELSEVKPVSVYLDSDKDKAGIFKGNLFTLPDFSKDGVYALELIAVDKAGNESVLNSNTYMRIVDSDVLAYISNSNAAEKTGWYSFQYENGEPISKRPDNFSDIDIVVLAKTNSQTDIVLRDYNGEEKNTDLQAQTDNSMYGVSVYRYTLKSDYFKENFQEDTDTELYLSVKNENGRIDLGKMHIDNIPPSCNIPNDLKSWHWYYGNESRTITVTNISELLDETRCKVYDNGKAIDFTYSAAEGSLSFTLNGGWHNVGITLEDVAGNTYSVQEVDNIHIGYFWLWIIIIASVIFIGITITIVYFVRKKRYS